MILSCLWVTLNLDQMTARQQYNKTHSNLWAYEAARSCAQPKNTWKFDQQNDFTVFFHLKSYYDLTLQSFLFVRLQ